MNHIGACLCLGEFLVVPISYTYIAIICGTYVIQCIYNKHLLPVIDLCCCACYVYNQILIQFMLAKNMCLYPNYQLVSF